MHRIKLVNKANCIQTALHRVSNLASVALTCCRRNEENFGATCDSIILLVSFYGRNLETTTKKRKKRRRFVCTHSNHLVWQQDVHPGR